MYRHLGSATMKTGEQMEIGVVECPDPSWGAQVMPLLGHKSQDTHHHFAAAFAGRLDALETRFYIGTIGGVAVTNVMIVGTHRGAAPGEGGSSSPAGPAVGILGHVYTRPEHRQKGAFGRLMAVQMDDCRRLGFRALTLGTGFETHPYWIYHSFGFRSVDGTTGKMQWFADAEFVATWFRPGSTHVRPLRWDDWAPLNLLAFQPVVDGEPLPRSWTFRVKGQAGGLEGAFQVMQRGISRGTRITGLVLESEHGATVGWAILQPDDLTFGDGLLLDLCVHPTFAADAPQLLAALPWPDSTPVRAYTTGRTSDYRSAALQAASFERAATLPGWLRTADTRADLQVWSRG